MTAPVGRALNAGLDQLVGRGLRGVWARGRLPAGPVVWAANHHSWWDGFVANAAIRHWARRPALLMDADNFDSFRFMATVGVIASDRPRQALDALRAGGVLIIFPEHDLQPPGPLAALARGAGWFAEHAPAELVPVALRVTNRGHQHAEALLDVGPATSAPQLAAALSGRLSALDEAIGSADPRAPLPGFELIVPGRQSWDERIDRWSRRLRR